MKRSTERATRSSSCRCVARQLFSLNSVKQILVKRCNSRRLTIQSSSKRVIEFEACVRLRLRDWLRAWIGSSRTLYVDRSIVLQCTLRLRRVSLLLFRAVSAIPLAIDLHRHDSCLFLRCH
jgi:hypothetical protein